MNYFNLPNELDALLKSASIVRPKITWFNLPSQLKEIKAQLLLINEDLEDEDLAVVLASIPNANWFNYLSVANKIKTSIIIINEL